MEKSLKELSEKFADATLNQEQLTNIVGGSDDSEADSEVAVEEMELAVDNASWPLAKFYF